MKKTVLSGSFLLLGLLAAGYNAQAQGAIVDGGTYKMTHYGVVADASQAPTVPAGSPLCLDVANGLPDAGTLLGQWGDNGFEAAQRFVFQKQTDGSFKIRHFDSNVFVQPVGGATVANTRIEQNVSTDADYQRWLITDPDNNGRYKFTLKGSANAAGVSQVLEVGFASNVPGAPVNLFDDNGFEPAQRWELTLTSSPLATKGASDALRTEVYPSVLGPDQRLSVRIVAQHSGPAQLEVLDMTGRRAYTQAATLQAGATTLRLDHPRLAAGLYIVRVQQDGATQQVKVVQQ